MVLVTLVHASGTVQVHFLPLGPVGRMNFLSFPIVVKPLVGGPHAVGFNINLIDHVEAVLVAQGVEERVFGVVTTPDRVYIILFHQPQVLQRQLLTDDVPGSFVVIVQVNAFNQDRLAVH